MQQADLVIFGWPDSCSQVNHLISEVEEPPLHVISIKGTFQYTRLSNFLYTLHKNLYLGIEKAIQAGAFSVGMYNNIARFLELIPSEEVATSSTSEAIALKRHTKSVLCATLKLEQPSSLRLSQLRNSLESFQGAGRGSVILVFTFEDESAMEQFERDFSVKLTRGPVVHPDGSFDISQSEITNLSFRTYKKEILTERWEMKSETEWNWEQLLKLFELPGVKFIREIVDEKTIVFEGTLYARSIHRSSINRSNSIVAVQDCDEVLSSSEFMYTLKHNRLAIHRAIQSSFLKILLCIPSLENQFTSLLRLKFNSDPDNTIEVFLDLISATDDMDLWKEFVIALDNNNLSSTRRLFVSDETFKSKF